MQTKLFRYCFSKKIDQEAESHIDSWKSELKQFKINADGITFNWARDFETAENVIRKIKDLDNKKRNLTEKLDLAKKSGFPKED